MSAILRYTHSIDGTIPVTALLYEDEYLLSSQEGVGLYDGPNKSAAHQSGAVHVTSHRLFFVSGSSSSSPDHAPSSRAENGASLSIDLSDIVHTESYAGFLMSSAKVTVYLREQNKDALLEGQQSATSSQTQTHGNSTSKGASGAFDAPTASSTSNDSHFDLWECEICGYRNPPGLSPSARNTCGLCGMPRASSSTPSSNSRPRTEEIRSPTASIPISSARHAVGPTFSNNQSRSLPTSSSTTPAPLVPSPRNEESSVQVTVNNQELNTIACSACTFLNHASLRDCEVCGTPLPPENTSAAGHNLISKSAPASRPASPLLKSNEISDKFDYTERSQYIRLSFRKGGDKAFYAALKTALQRKEWLTHAVRKNADAYTNFSGINSILQNIETNVQTTESGMSEAFSDLRSLMTKAQEMVRLAEDLNERLTAASGSASSDVEPLEPEEATFVRSSLGQLGVTLKNVPVTADMANDERKYLNNLAKELADVLQGRDNPRQRVASTGIMKARGIIGLDEAWVRWNRARGVALISPETTLKALEYLPAFTRPPITTRKLTSGLRVLHTPEYTIPAFAERLVGVLVDTGPLTTTQVANNEMLAVGLIEELISEVEDRGDIIRDDPSAMNERLGAIGLDIRWWANGFVGYVWDGQQG